MYKIPTVTVDKEKLEKLKEVYEGAMEHIKEGLPDINLNSRKDILHFFERTFQIQLKSTRIQEISEQIDLLQEDSEEQEIVIGIVYYFKMKYSLKNYIYPMIKDAPEVELETRFGRVQMKNHQPLPKSPEILECITRAYNGIKLVTGDGDSRIEVEREEYE